MIDDLLELNGLSIKYLNSLLYKSKLDRSLKNTLHHFDKDKLLEEVFEYSEWLDCQDISSRVSIDYRIKAHESIEDKYNRYFPNKEVNKTFNDILGFRAFCDSYAQILNDISEAFRVVDMSEGKAEDDGYRGVHIYYQIDNYHYPIEIQFNTFYDRQINNWLHDYLYKKNYPLQVGKEMRIKYEQGLIHSAADFEEVLNNGVFSGKE